MKKKYVSPSMQTWEIGSVSILAASDIPIAPGDSGVADSRNDINVGNNSSSNNSNIWDSNW